MKNKKKKTQKIPVSKNRLNNIIYLLLFVSVPSILYFRVVNFDFTSFDDQEIINNIQNEQGNPLNLHEAFTHDAFMDNGGDQFYRPMQTITFMIDAMISGRDTWIYHLSNLILHILTVITLFFFLIKIGIKKEISFILTLFYSIHPLLTNAVAWIPARGDILLCLFTMLAFISFIEYINTGKIIYLILHIIVFLSVVFTKETALLLPVLILYFHYFVQNNKFIFKNILPFLITWLISYALFFALRQNVIKVIPSSNVFGIIPLIKNLPVIPITFFKFFLPYGLCTMPFFDTISLICGIVLLVFFTGVTMKVVPEERRIVIWGAIWFLAFSIPSMSYKSFISTIGFDYFEYRTYLPMIGVLIIIGFLIMELFEGIKFRKIILISIPIFIIYSVISVIHLADFANPLSFYNSAIKTNSNNAIALEGRGLIYDSKGEKEKAMSDYDNSIIACSTFSVAYFNKGIIYSLLNDHYNAEHFYSLAINYDTLNHEINFLNENVYIYLSLEEIKLGKYDETKTLLKKAIKIYPNNSDLHYNLGWTYYSTKQFDSSLFEYNRGLDNGKGLPQYYDVRGVVKDSLKDFTGAVADFSKALELQGDFFDALKNRGITRIKINDYEGAVSDLTSAIKLNPDIGLIWYYRGLAFSKLNKQIEAEKDQAQARKLGFNESVYGFN